MLPSSRVDVSLPTGTVTFLFTDIEGSTRLWEAAPDAMRSARARHDALLRDAVAQAHGHVFKTVGDAFCAAFAVPFDALAAALAAQRALRAEAWPATAPIKVRIAVHSGAVELRDGDYFGPALNRVARLLPSGHGGQTLLSQTVCELCRDSPPEGASLRDLGSHQLRDLARPEQIYELSHPDLPGVHPPIASLSTQPNNLPRQLSSFIGREAAIAEVATLFAGTRLLTLTGAGGSGKTRLALQVAADSLEHFPDGAWLVELAALTDPGLVPQAVAMTLGVTEEPGKAITETLTGYLSRKRLLLLLDNCEHLLDASAKLVYALGRQCPGMRIMATSREALGIGGEQTYRVPSLSLPDRHATHAPDELSRFESVRLFVERALSVRPEFEVNAHNARALASLCCHLDGIPLAIELAAARVRSLSVEEIDGKLDHRFRLLTGGARTALPRQQTLRSLIDWSYDLLHGPERSLLQRLAVFAGGWTLKAAEDVCVGASVDDVLDRLTSLADKSLVIAEDNGGEMRYRLLETVRQYARDRLMESGGGERVRDRHRNHFLALAEVAESKLKGAEQVEWLRRLDQEHENLRAALEWAVLDAGSESALRLCGALQPFWWTRGHLSEGRDWCARALREPDPAATHTRWRAKAQYAAGVLALWQADYAASAESFRDAVEMQEALGDRESVALSLNGLGNVAKQRGDYPVARAHYEKSLAIRRELGDRRGIAASLNNLGVVAYELADFAAARVLYEEAVAVMRELGARSVVATALGNLGIVAYALGDVSTARKTCEESLVIMRELGDQSGIARSLNNLGDLAHDSGDFVGARKLFDEDLRISRTQGDKLAIAYALEGLAACAAGLGNPLRSARIWGAVERLRENVGSPLPRNERPRYDRRVAAARAELGDDGAFDRSWQEGRVSTLEQAMALALDDVEGQCLAHCNNPVLQPK